MAVEAFLVLRRPLEFPHVAVLALVYGGPVCPPLHVFVAGRPVAVHTFNPLMYMYAVGELDDLFLDRISEIEDILMTVQASLICHVIVGEKPSGNDQMGAGVAGETAGLLSRVPFGFLPQFVDQGVAFPAGGFVSC